MRILIFSDTHLYHHFDKKKYEFLYKTISNADTVVINGDFWDGYLTTFEKFIHSPWKKLFPLLKKKNTIYIYGNHDKKEWSDKRAHLFSTQQKDAVVLDFGNYRLLVEHGNRIAPKLDGQLAWIPRHPFFGYIAAYFQKIGLSTMGEGFLAFWYEKSHAKLRAYAQKVCKKQEILVCGHSHVANLSIGLHYANSGMIRDRIGQYLLIENEEIKLIKDHY